MTLGVLNRLLAMQPDELRFRVVCELRKLEGRMRSATSSRGWQREALAARLSAAVPGAADWPEVRRAIDRGDVDSAHRLLARHFTTRSASFPASARTLPAMSAAIRRDFPGAGRDAVERADRMLRGEYDLLGYRGLDLGQAPDWHADAVHDRRSPVVYWANVPYLDAVAGDHKVIWELNRHQHWLAFGRAHTLSGDRRYYDAFVAQLESWLGANPPLIGTNWASMLELGFRAISWLWSLEMFAGSAGREGESPWTVDLLLGLDRQLTHVEQNLSHYFSPNTHLSGEALALYVAGVALPELRASARRVALGRDVLIQEAGRQVRADGGHAELSAHYHRYSTDFYLLATRVAAMSGDPAAPIFEQAARSQAGFLRAICDDRGIRPQLGDDDGGQLFPICGSEVDDCRGTLGAAATLLRDPALSVGPLPEEAYWLCGPDASGATPTGGSHAVSAALTATGYYVSRTVGGDHLVFDAGPHGFLTGGHAHADALSLTLTVAGRPLLVDPGTATYTMDPELRDRFRSTMMHNTIAMDGRSQSEPRGPFQWATMTTAAAGIWRSGPNADYVEGTHTAYAPHRHTRSVVSIHGVGWWILDHLLGPPARRAVDAYWHFHPAWRVTADGPHLCRLTQNDAQLALATTAHLTLLAPGETPLAVRSPNYGVVEPAPVARGSLEPNLPATIATFIPATPAIATALTIEEVRLESSPGPHWHGSAFRVRWTGGTMLLLAAVESTGIANRDDAAPSDRWGTAEVRTDARVGLLIDYIASPSEALLINGTTMRTASGSPLLSLPRRTPIAGVTPLASPVHEVES